MKTVLPDVHFGSVRERLPAKADKDDIDDDEGSGSTPSDVVDILGFDPADAMAADEVTVYHGTRSFALQSIRDAGLLAHPFKRQHPTRFYQGERGASVYVTPDPKIAVGWALSEVDDPTEVTILEVVVPEANLHPDEEAPEAERYVGDIPPEWIKAAYPLLPDGQLGTPVEFSAKHADDAEKKKRFVAIKHDDEDEGHGILVDPVYHILFSH